MEKINPNSPSYWDEVYKKEKGTGKRRIDTERFERVVDLLTDYNNITYPNQRTLLDVGCGNGEMLRLIHAIFPEWKLYGIDITPETISWAKGVDSFDYRVMGAEDITFSAEFFDCIFCGETLEHLENPETVIYQMKKVLKPEGFLICSVPFQDKNKSKEHLREYTIEDCLQLTSGRLVDINVVKGLSIIWTVKK